MTNKNINIAITDSIDDESVIDNEFHHVNLECKESADVVDSENQKVNVEPTNETVDSLYKNEPLVDLKRLGIRRRRIYNLLAIAIGLIALIILLTIVAKPKSDRASMKKNTTGSGEDKAPSNNTKSKDAEKSTSVSQLMCATTTTSCPAYLNGTWTKLPEDIVGESQKDYAGYATALSCDGSILAVSSIHNSNKTGHVRVFKWANDVQVWTKMGKDIEGTSPEEDFGYSLAMTADGYQIAIGSRKNGDKAEGAGEVRVFTYFEQLWMQRGQDIQGEFGGDQSGRSVSLSMDGNRIAIGATNNTGTASGSGHARVFEFTNRNGTQSWVQLGQDLDGETRGDQFGRSVSLSGDGRRIAVGAHTYDTADGIVDAGHVRVFEYNSDNKKWTQVAVAIDGVKTDEYFGMAVSLSYDGSRLAIGSPKSDSFIFGVTRVYEVVNDIWSQMGTNIFGGGNTIDLTPNGQRVVIGSKDNFANGVDAGHLSIYEYNKMTSSWSQIGADINGVEGEMSATSVAISADGKRVVSSSPSSGAFNGTDDNGIVRVYDFC